MYQYSSLCIPTIVLLLTKTGVFANDFQNTCDGNTTPSWGDCDAIADQYDSAVRYFYKPETGTCFNLDVPNGTDPNLLNCVIQLCFENGQTQIARDKVYADYDGIRDFCDVDHQGDTAGPLGGTTVDETDDITIIVGNNNEYNPPSRSRIMKRRNIQAEYFRRDSGICTDGSGTYEIAVTNDNVEKPGQEKAVTGRLPDGSSYTIQQSDTFSVDVTESVSIEAGFFDLFDASAMVSVDEGYSKMTSSGVTVTVDCASGQYGIIYAYPTFKQYQGICTSNNNAEIDVWVPQDGLTNYRVSCLGDSS